MVVDLRKRIVDLSKKAAFAANERGIEGQRAQMVLVLDISASMNALYRSGVIQRAIERIFGLAVAFDDDGQIDLLLFGTSAYPLPPVTLDEIGGYVERGILARYKIREATNYAPPLRLLSSKYRSPPPTPAPALRVNVAAVSAASARVAPPQDRLAAASPHVQSVLGPVHRWRENAEEHRVSPAGFAAPAAPP